MLYRLYCDTRRDGEPDLIHACLGELCVGISELFAVCAAGHLVDFLNEWLSWKINAGPVRNFTVGAAVWIAGRTVYRNLLILLVRFGT